MINPKKKIWIDFTDMLSWYGHFSGTQRVTYELGKRFHEQGSNVAFFSFDERSKGFYEVSFSKIYEKIKQVQQVPSESSKGSSRNHFIKKKLKSITTQIYYRLPLDFRKRLTPERKIIIKKAYLRLKNIKKLLKTDQSSNLGLNEVIQNSDLKQFSKNDTVVILGKPWDNMSFIDILRKQKLEVNFSLIHLIYDMIPIFLPHVFGKPLPKNYTEYMFEAISLSDKLIAISESTKKDIKKFCNEELLPYPDTSVIKLGDSFSKDQSEENPFPNLSPNDFILCVGTIEIRKNHILLYSAYKEGINRGVQLPRLVIIGGIGWYTSDVLYEFQNDPELKNKVVIENHTNDRELAWLYKNCKFTVYPSVYEGWGLPIAEALAYGKMCLASNSSSMTEIAGDLIEYFSPYNSGELLDLIIKYLDQNTLSKKEIEILKEYKPITWDQTFKDFLVAVKNLN